MLNARSLNDIIVMKSERKHLLFNTFSFFESDHTPAKGFEHKHVHSELILLHGIANDVHADNVFLLDSLVWSLVSIRDQTNTSNAREYESSQATEKEITLMSNNYENQETGLNARRIFTRFFQVSFPFTFITKTMICGWLWIPVHRWNFISKQKISDRSNIPQRIIG